MGKHFLARIIEQGVLSRQSLSYHQLDDRPRFFTSAVRRTREDLEKDAATNLESQEGNKKRGSEEGTGEGREARSKVRISRSIRRVEDNTITLISLTLARAHASILPCLKRA